MKKIIPILAAALLAGCGEMRWAKPDGDSTTVAQDSASCRAAASEQIQRQYGPPQPMTTRPDAGRFGPDTGIPGAADRQVLESQVVDRCMRTRGYALVPAGK